MSNNISNKQINGSLAGQIALNLDKSDGADGKISQSVWNEFWEKNNLNDTKGKNENVGNEGISIQDAFKLIMTRIFNAAKKQLSKEDGKSWDNHENKYTAINDTAKDWLKKAGGEKLKAENIKTDTTKVQEAANITVGETSTSTQVTTVQHSESVTPPQKLKENIDKAKDIIKNNLNSLSEAELKQIGLTPAKRDRILNYISNIKYNNVNDSGQAIGTEIFISTNLKKKDYTNLANMVNLLMHEANHCDENYLQNHPEESEISDSRHRDKNGNPIVNHEQMNTKEEERACETLGVLTTALLIKKGALKGYEDYGRYGEQYNNNKRIPYTQYLDHPEYLERDISNWVNGYTNYPETLDGDITIEHMRGETIKDIPDSQKEKKIQIKKGDKFIIDNKEYIIGRGSDNFILSAVDSAPIFTLAGINSGFNNLVFDGMEPTKDEIQTIKDRTKKDDIVKTSGNYKTFIVKRGNDVICKGKLYL